jgi:hypothetical protein
MKRSAPVSNDADDALRGEGGVDFGIGEVFESHYGTVASAREGDIAGLRGRPGDGTS